MSGSASNLRERKPNGAANGAAANGASTNGNGNADSTVAVNMPTIYGQAMDKKLDTHESYEFGGPAGVTAMMIGFPLMMCTFTRHEKCRFG